jgi:hypothetical protein
VTPAVDEADLRMLARLAGVELEGESLTIAVALLQAVADDVAGFASLDLDGVAPDAVFHARWEP